MSFRMEVRMLCEKNGKRNSETERRIYASGDKLTASLTTVTDPSLPLRMTFNVLYKDHGVGRQKELLAHAVRLRYSLVVMI